MLVIDIDMKKPKTCWTCPFHDYHGDDRCFFLKHLTDDPYYSYHIEPNCPIKAFDSNVIPDEWRLK